jgi:hypothetical protein
MKGNNTPFVIISAKGAKNKDDTDLYGLLDRIGFNPNRVTGAYKGISEQKYLVYVPALHIDRHLKELIRIGQEFNQEALLFVDNERSAELIFTDGGAPYKLGHWKEIGADIPIEQDSYTEYNGKYYICE